MARTSDNLVRLFIRPGRNGRPGTWWAAFKLRDEDVAHLPKLRDPGSLLRQHKLKRDRRGWIRISLATADETVARICQTGLVANLKWLRAKAGGQTEWLAMNRKFSEAMFEQTSELRMTVIEYFDKMEALEKLSAAGWKNPIQGRDEGRITRATAADHVRVRRRFLLFLDEKFPGEVKWLREINISVAAAFIKWLENQGFKWATLRHYKDYFSGIWEDARRGTWNAEEPNTPILVETNPWQDVKLRRKTDANTDKITLLHEETLRQKARELYQREGSFDLDGNLFMLLTGCRPSDLCWITRGDIDFDRGVLKGLQSKVAAFKEIPITPLLRPILRRRLAAHDSPFLFAYKKQGEDFYRQCDRIQGTKRWNRELARIFGKRTVSCYIFRRTFRSAGEQLLIPERVLDRLMGHKRGKDMGDFYSHHNLEVLRQAAEKIQAHLVGEPAAHAAGQGVAARA